MKKEKKNEETNEIDIKKTLKELTNTIYWKAIRKVNYDILSHMDSSLRSLDPKKYSTEIARIQGQITGIYFLENYINGLLKNNKEEEIDIKY